MPETWQPIPEPRAASIAGWEKAKPVWSRTDTMRWLNDRSLSALAWMRRGGHRVPEHSNSMGRWLKDEQGEMFQRAHEKLLSAGKNQELREKFSVPEVLR